MKRRAGVVVAAALLGAGWAGAGAAQQDTSRVRTTGQPGQVQIQAGAQQGQPAPMQRTAAQGGTPNYDVVLEVPNLSVDSIGLTVANLRAHLALSANAARLVSVNAGADVRIDRVRLDIVGVQAEAYLYVDLDNVARIVNRVVTTLDRNPRILTQVLATVDTAVGVVGRVGNQALAPGGPVSRAVGATGQALNNVTAPGGLLSQTVNTLGQTVQRTLTQTGTIVERTLDRTGRVVGTRTVANLLSLPALQQTTNAAGQVVRQVRDESGAVIELVLDRAGRVTSSRILSAAPR
jgi:hypothetical protein